MSKGQKRGNREAKKPKKEKPKAAVAASPFAHSAKGRVPLEALEGKRRRPPRLSK